MRARVPQHGSPFSASCIICFILLLLLTPLDRRSACSAHQQPAPCPAARREQADDCASLLFLFGEHSRRVFPSTLLDADAYCRQLQRAATCVNNYSSSCLRGLPRTASMLMLQGASKQVNRMCSGDRRQLLHHAPCLNAHKKQLDKCMVEYMRDVAATRPLRVPDKIPAACCSFYSFSACVRRVIGSGSSRICAPASRTFITSMMDSLAADSVNLLCRQTPERSASCRIPRRTPSSSSSSSSRVDAKSLLLVSVRAWESIPIS